MTFRDNLYSPYSEARHSSWTAWPFKMVPKGCHEKSVRYYHCMLGNNPEERSSQFTPRRKHEITHHCDPCLYRNSNPDRQTVISFAGCKVENEEVKMWRLMWEWRYGFAISFPAVFCVFVWIFSSSKSFCFNAILFISSFLSNPQFRSVRPPGMHFYGLAKRPRI